MTLLARFCREHIPRSCEHFLLANLTRKFPRPCSFTESYLTSGDTLTLELKLADSTALKWVWKKWLFRFNNKLRPFQTNKFQSTLRVCGPTFGRRPLRSRTVFTEIHRHGKRSQSKVSLASRYFLVRSRGFKKHQVALRMFWNQPCKIFVTISVAFTVSKDRKVKQSKSLWMTSGLIVTVTRKLIQIQKDWSVLGILAPPYGFLKCRGMMCLEFLGRC